MIEYLSHTYIYIYLMKGQIVDFTCCNLFPAGFYVSICAVVTLSALMGVLRGLTLLPQLFG